jgi:hypothetical protein
MKAYLRELMRAQCQEAAALSTDPAQEFLLRVLASGEFRTSLAVTPWGMEVAVMTVQDSYTAWVAQLRHAPPFAIVMKRLRRLLPPGSLRKVRKRKARDRMSFYWLPDLEEARAYFSTVTGIARGGRGAGSSARC